jgi:hypothetical protein
MISIKLEEVQSMNSNMSHFKKEEGIQITIYKGSITKYQA